MVNEIMLEQTRSLLANLQDRGLIESFHYEAQEKRLEQTKQLLALFEAQKLHHFDIFRKAGFLPTETMFSNAIAALLDPKEGHGLGTLPLEKLLDRIATKDLNPESEVAVQTIKATLAQNRPHISIHREKREKKTIPDITLVSNDFAIFIENKIMGGIETYIDGEAQTKRQWQVLEQKYRQRNRAILGIFLTPEGNQAEESNFIPLSVRELVICLRDAAEGGQAQHAINTFLDFYGWQ